MSPVGPGEAVDRAYDPRGSAPDPTGDHPMSSLTRLLTLVSVSAMFAALAVTASAAPSEEPPPTEPPATSTSCTVELDGRKLARGPGTAGPGTVEDRTAPVALPLPVGPGLVGVAGVYEDDNHADSGAPDQTGERFSVLFVDAEGRFVGLSMPTPDLPADVVRADFRLPPTSLSGTAVAVILVHAGPGIGANSIRPVCLEIAPVIELLPVPLIGLPPSPPPGTSGVRDVPCDARLVPVGTRCLRLAVPERHGDPTSREIAIAAYVLPATGSASAPDPIFYLRGGPGGSGVGALPELARLTALRVTRDIVVVDQRGTGFSEPALTCPEIAAAQGPEGARADAVSAAAWRACNARLRAEGVDLDAYTTAATAQDLEALRRALGAPSVNLYGTSYGSSVALVMMKAFPGSVRSSVLDGPYPPQVNGLSDDAPGLHWLLDIIPAVCAADAACAAAHPDVRGDLIAAVSALDAEPATVVDGRQRVEVDGLALLSVVVADISQPGLPSLFRTLASGDAAARSAALAAFAATSGPPTALLNASGRDADRDQRLTLAEGTFANVTCAEEAPFDARPATVFPGTTWSPRIDAILRSRADLVRFICANWSVGAAPAETAAPVISAVPTLILAGGADPQTPLPWAVLAGRGLSRSTLAIIPRGGHVLGFGNACAGALQAAFTADPTAAVDLACTRAEPPIAYSSRPAIPSRRSLAGLPV